MSIGSGPAEIAGRSGGSAGRAASDWVVRRKPLARRAGCRYLSVLNAGFSSAACEKAAARGPASFRMLVDSCYAENSDKTVPVPHACGETPAQHLSFIA